MTLNRKLFLYLLSAFFSLIAVITFFQYQREKEFRTEQLDQLLDQIGSVEGVEKTTTSIILSSKVDRG